MKHVTVKSVIVGELKLHIAVKYPVITNDSDGSGINGPSLAQSETVRPVMVVIR